MSGTFTLRVVVAAAVVGALVLGRSNMGDTDARKQEGPPGRATAQTEPTAGDSSYDPATPAPVETGTERGRRRRDPGDSGICVRRRSQAQATTLLAALPLPTRRAGRARCPR